MTIRKAKISDVRQIQKLIELSAKKGEMLSRSLSELYDNLRDYYIYQEEGQGQILGTCAMHICWEDLAEIRSLVVREEYNRRGIGTKLIEACLSEAISLGLYRIFALTYKPDFFRKFGFKVVDKSTLPHKIWADCIKCVKFPECDEMAVLLEV
ncbi:MAG: N-acetyltransferase [Deltaproteobacteria bacterium]|jgi:amino-acid N-acetyltransferase|nr:N-acetyltransferase [Deltaproteobacteria bacterium]